MKAVRSSLCVRRGAHPRTVAGFRSSAPRSAARSSASGRPRLLHRASSPLRPLRAASRPRLVRHPVGAPRRSPRRGLTRRCSGPAVSAGLHCSPGSSPSSVWPAAEHFFVRPPKTMGYDIHITRKAHWASEDGPTISEQEWRQIIQEDPDLALDTETLCGDMAFASWKGEAGSLAYSDGEITTKNPSDSLIRMMVIIAAKLCANVQGDDGELYLPTGKPVLDSVQVVAKYPWWLLGLCLFSIGCFVVVLLQVAFGG